MTGKSDVIAPEEQTGEGKPTTAARMLGSRYVPGHAGHHPAHRRPRPLSGDVRGLLQRIQELQRARGARAGNS